MLNNQLQSDDEKKHLFKDFNDVINLFLKEGESIELKHPQKENAGISIHEKVVRKVFRRLVLRSAQLSLLTHLAKESFTNLQSDLKDKPLTTWISEPKSSTDNKHFQSKDDSIDYRAYKHAITDLFVEKALTYLEEKADDYSRFGRRAYYVGLTTIFLRICIAAFQYLIPQSNLPSTWEEIIKHFIAAFTFYSFIVLVAVGLWRFGRAILDQAERLLERRHALRQGRLFVHLHDGDMSIDEMEKAFNRNVSQSNAFGNMATGAKVPWEVVLSEAIKVGAEVVKATKKKQNAQTK